MTLTTPREVNAIVQSLAPYRSEFTGKEYDTAVRVALTLQDYIDAHVQIPFIVFTGDYETQKITHLERGTWIHQIVTYSEIPFSKSAPKYEYDIIAVLPDPTEEDPEHTKIDVIQKIDVNTMLDTDLMVTYPVDREIPPGADILMRASSINAFGRFRVKLITG